MNVLENEQKLQNAASAPANSRRAWIDEVRRKTRLVLDRLARRAYSPLPDPDGMRRVAEFWDYFIHGNDNSANREAVIQALRDWERAETARLEAYIGMLRDIHHGLPPAAIAGLRDYISAAANERGWTREYAVQVWFARELGGVLPQPDDFAGGVGVWIGRAQKLQPAQRMAFWRGVVRTAGTAGTAGAAEGSAGAAEGSAGAAEVEVSLTTDDLDRLIAEAASEAA